MALRVSVSVAIESVDEGVELLAQAEQITTVQVVSDTIVDALAECRARTATVIAEVEANMLDQIDTAIASQKVES